MKKIVLNVACLVLVIASLIIVVVSFSHKSDQSANGYEDGVKQVDLNSIYLEGNGVSVDFSDVILSKQEEMRKLIVSTQDGTVSMNLTSSLIKKLDFDFLKKTQKISYTGTGYFVVDLDQLGKGNVIQDDKNKTVTIRINHAYLQTIDIDPNEIIIDEVKESLLARGDIKLTVHDYNSIEKELRQRMEDSFNTVENGQQADENALRMVKEVYEPIVNAVDKRYEVVVEFVN